MVRATAIEKRGGAWPKRSCITRLLDAIGRFYCYRVLQALRGFSYEIMAKFESAIRYNVDRLAPPAIQSLMSNTDERFLWKLLSVELCGSLENSTRRLESCPSVKCIEQISQRWFVESQLSVVLFIGCHILGSAEGYIQPKYDAICTAVARRKGFRTIWACIAL